MVIDDVYVPIILEEARTTSSTSGKKFLELFDVGLSNCNEHLVRHKERKDNHNVVMFSSFIAEQCERLFNHLLLTLEVSRLNWICLQEPMTRRNVFSRLELITSVFNRLGSKLLNILSFNSLILDLQGLLTEM